MSKRTRNRAKSKHRPRDSRTLRVNAIAEAICKASGTHQFIFYRGDNYGCCPRCGSEVLL